MALRRDRDKDAWRTLPASGRSGAPPDWPLTRQTARERELWDREWQRPQAIAWEENGQQAEVALYVRSFAAAEKTNAPVAARVLVRQQQEGLGLSLPGLARLRWRIGAIQEHAERMATGTDGPSAKDRWKVIDGSG